MSVVSESVTLDPCPPAPGTDRWLAGRLLEERQYDRVERIAVHEATLGRVEALIAGRDHLNLQLEAAYHAYRAIVADRDREAARAEEFEYLLAHAKGERDEERRRGDFLAEMVDRLAALAGSGSAE